MRGRLAGTINETGVRVTNSSGVATFVSSGSSKSKNFTVDFCVSNVTGALPWTEAVFQNLPRGPVYLTNYRRDIRDLGFRLRPDGDLWQVLERINRKISKEGNIPSWLEKYLK